MQKGKDDFMKIQKEKTVIIKKSYIWSAIAIFLVITVCLVATVVREKNEMKLVSNNDYNMAFYELVDYVQNVETYLAKSLISSTPEHGAETLTNVWREANLAQTYLSRLPIESQELENTQKFLNQVSDYSYSLSRKNIYNESLTDEDLKNLKDLHDYSTELENTLNQLSEDINMGRVTWDKMTNKSNKMLAQQVSTNLEGLSNLEENFHEYSGLIYDGAFSEHVTSSEAKGLTGDDIDEETAKQKAIEFIGNEKIKEIQNMGLSENATIPEYNFSIKTNKEDNITISVSKKGGHIIYMNSNREVNTEIISQDEANRKGKEFLEEKGFKSMKETYYLKQDGIVTINYAYVQDNVTVYSDLIKVKVALDNGEILGIETTGYLNNHTQRNIEKKVISKDDAKKTLNKQLNIESEGFAYIPTEWKTEILCYEFKGKVDDKEFLVYINAENGKEEDILVIKNTPNGVLTM